MKKFSLGLLAICILSSAAFADPNPARYTCISQCVVLEPSTSTDFNVRVLGTVLGKSDYSTDEAWSLMLSSCESAQANSRLFYGQRFTLSNLENVRFSKSSSRSETSSKSLQYDLKLGIFKYGVEKSTTAKGSESSSTTVEINVPVASPLKDCVVNELIPQSEIPSGSLNRYGG